MVEVRLRVEHEAFLLKLKLMKDKHEHDADQERNESGVERNAQALGDASDIAFHGPMSLSQRLSDAAYGTDEADGGDSPGDVAHHGELGVQSPRLGVGDRVRGGGDILDVARGTEASKGRKQSTRKEQSLLSIGKRLELPRVLSSVLGENLGPVVDRDQIELKKPSFA